LPAFDVSVSGLPAGRRIRVTFNATVSTDSAPTIYGFILVFAGFQRRVTVTCPIAGNGITLSASYNFTTTTALQTATGGVSTGAVLAGNGPCYLHTTSYDGPTQFIVEDLGAA
jgi:hypothetical protein